MFVRANCPSLVGYVQSFLILSVGMPHPQKKYFRQRAHANPLSDHTYEYPLFPSEADWNRIFALTDCTPKVDFVDVGCGYGGLLISLAKLYPDNYSLGFELRVKVNSELFAPHLIYLFE